MNIQYVDKFFAMPYKTQATQALYAWDYGLGGVEGAED